MKEYDISADEQREVDLSEEPAEPTAPPTIDPDEKIEAEEPEDEGGDDDARPL
ncbi:hypothetical protein [Ruicaihuangia caeni]|uniref:Uncharacterized protein n=1 Tax=Ruicaihuangia caeni TaxID=3042517 RepID=A0AAW6T790_9MICO|nr:hypothetical protein [Klugiella sp. YN-L-19]MDI2099695.1 hypothetical protein [Klugiella sp. YN-L-19]